MDVKGLQRNCDQCRFRMLSGNSCHKKEALGSPVKDKIKSGEPYYSTNDKRVNNSQFVLENCFNYDKNTGLLVSFHGSDGKEIACSVVRNTATTDIASTLIAMIEKTSWL